ncbi:hypothetical protein P8452_37062 [Trifolium repens]|nr:hypothetical protein P8452_37062 [Trifolium repens]
MSSVSKSPSNSTEESGWTTYFDDFFNKNSDDYDSHKCSSVNNSISTSSSLLSDATSFVDKNVLSHNEHVEIVNKEFSLNKNCKTGSSSKKRKNILDQALEDTATSPPLNSLKEKGNTSRQKELSLNEKDSDCTELKKRGLCVVPL